MAVRRNLRLEFRRAHHNHGIQFRADLHAGPGTLGPLGRQWIEAPAHASLDVNLVKRIRLAERKELEIRIDAVSVLNNPRWSFVSTDISSTNFGRLTAGDPTGANQADNPISGRRFSFTARLNF